MLGVVVTPATDRRLESPTSSKSNHWCVMYVGGLFAWHRQKAPVDRPRSRSEKFLHPQEDFVLLHLVQNPPDENQGNPAVEQGLIRRTKDLEWCLAEVAADGEVRRPEPSSKNQCGLHTLNGAKFEGRFCSSASSTESPRREPE